MARKVQTIPVTGAVLQWAREDREMSLREAARALKISPAELTAIEQGSEVSAKLFRDMRRVYGRTESVLLLSSRPESGTSAVNRRTVPGLRPHAPSLETIRAIRDGRRIQRVISELVEEDRELVPFFGLSAANEADDPESVAVVQRRLIGVSVDTQHRWKDRPRAFTHWRAIVQGRGILVLNKDMPREDCRGVSLTQGTLTPVVIVTTDDSAAGRIFTLFHEFGHILLRAGSSCVLSPRTDAEATEHWCNRFAAAFLMPAEDVRSLVSTKFGHLTKTEWTLEDVTKAATWFRVSPFAMARRLSDLDQSDYYRRNANELWEADRKNQRFRNTKQESGIPSPVTSVREMGTTVGSAIMDAVQRGLLDRADASGVLGIGSAEVDRFERELTEQRHRETT